MRSEHKYYLYDAITTLGIAATFTSYAPFLLSIGLSFAEISLLNAVFWLVAILAELPTGMLADGKSRAWSLKMGCVCMTFGGLVYVFSFNFLSALIGESLIAIGMAFFSGAEQAWITDALTREGRDHERRHIFGTRALVHGLVVVIGGGLCTFIALSNVRLIWIPMIVLSPVAYVFIAKNMNGHGEAIHPMSEMEALRSSIALLKRSRALVWVILAMVVSGGVVAFNHFWSPYFQSLVGTLGLSYVWAIIYTACALSGLWVRRIQIPQGSEANLILVTLALSGIGLLIPNISSTLGISLIGSIIHEVGRGTFAPLVDSFVQHRVESGYRATFGSLQSFLCRIGLALTSLFLWMVLQTHASTPETILFVWSVCGVGIVMGVILLYGIRPRS